MPSRLYIRAWKKEDNTSVNDRELVYVRSEKALYIGNGEAVNRTDKLCAAGEVQALQAQVKALEARIKALEDK